MGNPIGLHIQAQGVPDKNALLTHIAASQYTTVTVMDDFGLAMQIKNMVPSCVVVYRASDWEPSPGADAVPSLKRFLGSITQDKRIVIMVNCEQYRSSKSGATLPESENYFR
jgi:hypothetical protein